MADLAVTDTHALVWYGAGEHRRLGREALRLFQRADAGEAAIYVPTVSLVEVSELVHLGRIDLGRGFTAWMDDLLASGTYLPADLTAEIVGVAERLFSIPERGDRLIAATALRMEVPLLTRDPGIGRAAGVEVVW